MTLSPYVKQLRADLFLKIFTLLEIYMHINISIYLYLKHSWTININ